MLNCLFLVHIVRVVFRTSEMRGVAICLLFFEYVVETNVGFQSFLKKRERDLGLHPGRELRCSVGRADKRGSQSGSYWWICERCGGTGPHALQRAGEVFD